MSLPAPNLDDLRFQRDLVDEARRRIIGYCPEWTDYNLSDPGITLIELFAWMSERIIYRLNRVPEKNYIKFLELLGAQLQPASSAKVELTFRLSAPFPVNPEEEMTTVVPQGLEVATQQTDEEREVIFTTDKRLVVRSPKLTQLRREKEFHKNYLPRLGIEIFHAFDEQKPQFGDTFYLGFDENEDISGHILQLSFTSERTQAIGVKRDDPPWVWEASIGDGRWVEIPPSNRPNERDTTGGLNNPQGRLILYLPLSLRPDQVNGRNGYWVRCRFEQRRPEQGQYSESPRVLNVVAHTLGASTWATHAIIVRDELLGLSNGEPNQVFHLQNSPILTLQDGETVEIEENRHGEAVLVPWQRVTDFSQSSRYDRHFTLDTANGEVRFGPAIRQRDGTVRQYGRIPEANQRIQFKRYRYGGGIAGNVPAGRIQVLKSAVPFVDQVTNLGQASGGRNQEDVEEAKLRAARELRAQLRAVTAEDYENLAKMASRSIARVKGNIPQTSGGRLPPGMIEILLVPAVADALKLGDLSKLHVDQAMVDMVEDHLDKYRLLTTTLRIREPSYLGVKVRAEIVPSEYSLPELVLARVVETLRAFINPLPTADTAEIQDDLMGEGWEGWPFGRDLYIAEIFSLIQRIPGVKHVLDVSLSTRPVVPVNMASLQGDEAQAEEALTPLKQKLIQVSSDTLLCSLDHEVVIANLGGENGSI